MTIKADTSIRKDLKAEHYILLLHSIFSDGSCKANLCVVSFVLI